jgi:hypothetical protein
MSRKSITSLDIDKCKKRNVFYGREENAATGSSGCVSVALMSQGDELAPDGPSTS